jgi:hypothetical protein
MASKSTEIAGIKMKSLNGSLFCFGSSSSPSFVLWCFHSAIRVKHQGEQVPLGQDGAEVEVEVEMVVMTMTHLHHTIINLHGNQGNGTAKDGGQGFGPAPLLDLRRDMRMEEVKIEIRTENMNRDVNSLRLSGVRIMGRGALLGQDQRHLRDIPVLDLAGHHDGEIGLEPRDQLTVSIYSHSPAQDKKHHSK